jgi:ankyrin repeat protein
MRCGYYSTDRDSVKLASREGRVEVVRLLIECRADITAQDESGETPLHLSSEVEVARMLLEHDVDVTVQNKDGETPLHDLATSSQRSWPRVSPQKHTELVHLLLEHGADATSQEPKGSTPIHLVSHDEGVEVACLLIEHGAEVTTQNKDGVTTPLHLVTRWGQVEAGLEVARMLIGMAKSVRNRFAIYCRMTSNWAS